MTFLVESLCAEKKNIRVSMSLNNWLPGYFSQNIFSIIMNLSQYNITLKSGYSNMCPIEIAVPN